ncbi:hypothetical protein [Sporosarcina sp. G11-34]|uniref:hypothetical protein n=1 Tax=Sporosarcina sp. G11-34 TaxID=2849605 RepID=UPI0022A8FFCE|nr:hypothetical protein [Sporosarcina sp. G11-34]MCZ2258447.1 hypothetical protein [Sporosarcina sp. G11-34]
MKESVSSADMFWERAEPHTANGHSTFPVPCGWVPVYSIVCQPFMHPGAIQHMPMPHGGFNVEQLKQPAGHHAGIQCKCNPCMCTRYAHCGCGGSHSMRMPAEKSYCNVCSQSIQLTP